MVRRPVPETLVIADSIVLFLSEMRPFVVSGSVVKGFGRGSKDLDIPTGKTRVILLECPIAPFFKRIWMQTP
jgi:hypothetical protein